MSYLNYTIFYKAKLWLSALVSKAQDIVDVSKLLDKLEYIIAP